MDEMMMRGRRYDTTGEIFFFNFFLSWVVCLFTKCVRAYSLEYERSTYVSPKKGTQKKKEYPF